MLSARAALSRDALTGEHTLTSPPPPAGPPADKGNVMWPSQEKVWGPLLLRDPSPYSGTPAPLKGPSPSTCSHDVFPVCRCVCQSGGLPGSSAGPGGLLQVHHPGTQRDLPDPQAAPEHHGGPPEAAPRQERQHGAVREPVSPPEPTGLLLCWSLGVPGGTSRNRCEPVFLRLLFVSGTTPSSGNALNPERRRGLNAVPAGAVA